jgi:hypothetical protein
MSSFASAFTTGVASLDENHQDPPKPEVVVRMLVENSREVAYSVKKHRGGHNSVPGFEMDCPMGPEDCLKKGIYRWQKSIGFVNPFKHLLACCFNGQENAMYGA